MKRVQCMQATYVGPKVGQDDGFVQRLLGLLQPNDVIHRQVGDTAISPRQ